MSIDLVSPEGFPIIGTAEVVLATARIAAIDPDAQEPLYEGGSEIHWNTQETQHRNGKVLFVCSHGQDWAFDQLTQVVARP